MCVISFFCCCFYFLLFWFLFHLPLFCFSIYSFSLFRPPVSVLLISASAFLPGATIKRASGGGEDDKNKGKQLQGLSHLFLSSLSPQ